MPATAALHRITRRPDEQSLHLSDEPISSANLSMKMLAEIKGLFNRRANKRCGRFADEGTAFKGLLLSWREEQINFTQFSRRVSEQLAMMIEQQDLESDGQWLFLYEEDKDHPVLWIAKLTEISAYQLDANQDLVQSTMLDLAKTGLCFRINLSGLHQPHNQRFLWLTFGFGDRSLQPTLVEFFGFYDTVDAKADTEQFMASVQAYSQQLPEETGKRFQKEVAEYCIEQSSQGETVNLRELNGAIESVPEGNFSDFVAEHAPQVKDDFIPDTASLKRYIRYTGRSRDVSISFSNEQLGKTIAFNPETETLTIRELPSALVKQLKKPE